MSTVELIVFCVLVVPMIAAFIWALVVETKINARMRRSFSILAETQTAFYRVANCIIREKYRNIMKKNYTEDKQNENCI